MEDVRPDAFLVLGDTNSCLCAIAAKKRKIYQYFIWKLENRCFDQRVPEETNRKIVDHIADINLTLQRYCQRNIYCEKDCRRIG